MPTKKAMIRSSRLKTVKEEPPVYSPEELQEIEDLREARPKTRADCESGPRPCPYVSCRHHLYLDVFEDGELKVNFKDRDVDDIPETCSLDLTRGGMDLEKIGVMLNLTRERVRQILEEAFHKIRTNLDDEDIRVLFSFRED